MRPFRRRTGIEPAQENPLVPIVRQLGPTGKRAMYAASNHGSFERGTWRGCALNRAGTLLGESVSDRDHAARVLETTPAVVSRFISAWDQLDGTKAQCTELLREALLTVGLFTEPVTEQTETATPCAPSEPSFP